MHGSLPPVLALRGGSPLALLGPYNRALVAAPLLTNTVTAAGLSVLSDGVAQRLESGAAWNVERGAWQAVWGAVISGAMLFFWFKMLALWFPRARDSVTHLVLKVCVNQIVMSPGLNGGFFAFVMLTRMRPKLQFGAEKRRAYAAKCRQDLLPTCLRSCVFWTLVQTLNFRVLPPELTTVSTNVFFLIWTTIDQLNSGWS